MTDLASTPSSASDVRPGVGSPAPGQISPASGQISPAWLEAFERAPRTGLAFTLAAAGFAREKLAKRGTPSAAVRLGIKGGGCSGFSYVIQFEDGDPKPRDYAWEVDGIRFLVDKKSFVYLAGTTLDYEKTLMFQGFKFKNPNEATSCGCGHSFTVR